MMKKSYLLLLALFANVYGQTYTGFVKDVSGTEISYVIIEELDSESVSYTHLTLPTIYSV